MFLNFVGAVSDYFSNELSETLSREINESRSLAEAEIKLVVPYALWLMLDFTSKSDSQSHVFYQLCLDHKSLIQSSVEEKKVEEKVTIFFQADEDLTLLKMIGEQMDIDTHKLEHTTHFLFPYILGILGKYAEKNQLSADGLLGFLSSLRNNILHSFPRNIKKQLSQNQEFSVFEKQTKKKSFNKIWPWIAVVLIAAIIFLWLFS